MRKHRKGKGPATKKRKPVEPASTKRKVFEPPAKRRKVTSVDGYSDFPNDEHLFEDDDEAPDEEGSGLEDMTGEDLYLYDLDNHDSSLAVPQLNVKLTAGLCYLGLLYARQNVLPTDIIDWIATNKLPFYDLPTLLPRHLTCCNTRLTRRLIPAVGVAFL